MRDDGKKTIFTYPAVSVIFSWIFTSFAFVESLLLHLLLFRESDDLLSLEELGFCKRLLILALAYNVISDKTRQVSLGMTARSKIW